MDASLAQVDWNAAAKKPGEELAGKARQLREDTRRALLTAFAPSMVLNDWAGDEPPSRMPTVEELPDLHPVAALGVLEWVAQTNPFPNEWWLTIWRAMPSIEAAASVNTV